LYQAQSMDSNKLVYFGSGVKDDFETGEEILAQNVSIRSFLTEDATPSTDTPVSSLLPTSFNSGCSSDRSLESDNVSGKETSSVSKILSKLLSRSSNRKCADCRAQLLNSSKTFVSFSPSLDKLPNDSSKRRSIPRFSYNHRLFAPDSTFKGNSNLFQKEIDPAHRVTKLLNGHGVFICKACAKAHSYLGPTITTIKSVQNFSLWNQEEVQFLRKSGSNKSSWLIYEAYIPEKWLRYMPSASSGLETRLNFIRAKYEALAFVLPSSDSIIASQAWQRILEKDVSLQRYLRPACPLMFLSKLLLINDNGIEDIQSSNDNGMPDRLVDFFCVVGPKMKLHPEERHTDFYDIESPEHLKLEPHVIDCYPESNAHTDMEFPEHISNFVYPDGCCLSETHQPPTLFTFVLTSATGQRLYCAALRIYDETMETSQVKGILEASDYSVPLPWWISDVPSPSRNEVSARQPSDIVFVPKSLVVISHFPFFHAFREFLKQLYQLSVMETPLPIERYIANFISEIPLPPPGKVEVKFGFMSVVQFTIFRSAPNELPTAKFSFRPLFTALSISNILVVFGCLLEETKVVLFSKNIGLLTPCAEAFLSFLFPFEWQGIYIPVMPSSLLEVLEAPVPFLVGLHSRYLKEVKVQYRPKGVVLVDLDNDIVHLGFCESMHNGGFHEKRLPPSLPEKVSMKLRNKLQGCASCQYVPPGNGIKGSITYGDAEQLPNGLREPYAHIEPFHAAPDDDSRSEILEESDQAYSLDDGLSTTQGFFSENGQLAAKMPNKPDEKSLAKPKLFTKLKAKIDRRQNSQLSSSDGNTSNSSINWLDLHDLNEVRFLIQ
jgi:DENN domain-containing protein 5